MERREYLSPFPTPSDESWWKYILGAAFKFSGKEAFIAIDGVWGYVYTTSALGARHHNKDGMLIGMEDD